MQLIKEILTWQPIINNKKFDIPIFTLYYPPAITRNETQLHFYSGLGEEELLTKAGVKKLAECGLYAVGIVLPFHHLPPTAENIQRTLIEVPQFVAETFNKRAGNPKDKPVDIFGKSQGGGAVLLAACFSPTLYRIVASLLPAGLNKEALGHTKAERRSELKRRLIILNNLKKEQQFHDPRNIIAWYEVLKRVLKDTFAKRLNQKLDYTLSMDLTNLPPEFTSLTKLSKTHSIAIFAGKNDPVVRIEEVHTTLKRLHLDYLLHEVPSIHANSASKAGQLQISLVANWIKVARSQFE